MAQRVNLFLDDDFANDIKARKPKSLSLSAFCALLIEQSLDRAATLGLASGSEASTSNSSTSKKPLTSKSICPELQQHEELITQFWKVKKGSKGDVAWKLLQTELSKLQDAYGPVVVAEQLQLAINGKWAGVSYARYEQFKPQGKTVTTPPRRRKTEAEIQAEEEAAHQQRLREMGLI